MIRIIRTARDTKELLTELPPIEFAAASAAPASIRSIPAASSRRSRASAGRSPRRPPRSSRHAPGGAGRDPAGVLRPQDRATATPSAARISTAAISRWTTGRTTRRPATWNWSTSPSSATGRPSSR